MAKNRKRRTQRRKKRYSKIKKPLPKSSHARWQLLWVALFIAFASGAYMSVGANCAGGGASASITPTPQPGVVYFLDDHLGNTHLVTDSLGNVLHEESRHPYGLERNSINNDPTAKPYYSYTGKEYDEETGLVYFGGRYNSPELGRWITPDPLPLGEVRTVGIKQPKDESKNPWGEFGNISGNLYGYVDNNPTSKIDPDGYQTMPFTPGMSTFNFMGAPITMPHSSVVQMQREAEVVAKTYEAAAVAATGIAASTVVAPVVVNACASNPALCVEVGTAVVRGIVQATTDTALSPGQSATPISPIVEESTRRAVDILEMVILGE